MLAEKTILSVSQLNRTARQLLETHLSLLWVEGEISNFTRPSSGHWYFTLKDADAQVRCAMFRNRNQRIRTTPQNGQSYLLRARVSLYEGRGDYQLIVEHIQEAGMGKLQQAYEALKAKLQQEGLFSEEHKQPLPAMATRIGVVTSPSGAALHDILQVTQRRFPSANILVFPVAVQGNEAAAQIVNAIATANRHDACDLLIVGRGGGSLEDLWPFNEESVARAIFDSKLPIISAVGHETDITIADFVADVRAPTPSAAAELCTPNAQELQQRFYNIEQRLTREMANLLSRLSARQKQLSARLQHPGQRLQNQMQRLDHLEMKLLHRLEKQLQTRRTRLERAINRLQQANPQKNLLQIQERIANRERQLTDLMHQQIERRRQRLATAAALLNNNNPISVLARGYSITSDEQGQILRSATNASAGQRLITRLNEGSLVSEVVEVQAPSSPESND